jgi:hypothetical protein
MVGKAHRCATPRPVVLAPAVPAPEKSREPAPQEVEVEPAAAAPKPAYRYRDPEKRRAYMRDLMRKQRAKA